MTPAALAAVAPAERSRLDRLRAALTPGRLRIAARLLSVFALLVFFFAPFVSGCTGAEMLRDEAVSVKRNITTNPLAFVDPNATQAAKAASVQALRHRGLFLLFLSFPVAVAGLFFVPRGRFPKLATLVALPGTVAAGAAAIASGIGVATWTPQHSTAFELVVKWTLGASPALLPIFLLVPAWLAVWKGWPRERKLLLASSVLAVLGGALYPISLLVSHRLKGGSHALSLCLGLALLCETLARPTEPAPNLEEPAAR